MFFYYLISCITIVIIVIALLSNRKNERDMKEKTKRFDKIIDQFKNIDDLSAFLENKDNPLVDTFFGEPKWDKTPLMTYTLLVGIVLLTMSLGFLYLTLFVEDDIIFPLSMASTSGLGLLIAHYVLRRLNS